MKITGNKRNLKDRLRIAADGEDEIPGGEEEEEEAVHERRVNVKQTRQEQSDHDDRYSRAVLSFEDVEDALDSFSGDRGENVICWLSTFEETAETCVLSSA